MIRKSIGGIGSNNANEKLEFAKKRDMKSMLNVREQKMLNDFKKSVAKHTKIKLQLVEL